MPIKIDSLRIIEPLGGEWVCYSSPGKGGADYVAVNLPVFAPKPVHRDD